MVVVMFHIGVVAPTLAGGADFLRRLRPDGRRANDRQLPELTLSWAALAAGDKPWQRADADTVRNQLALNSTRLRQAGAHFFVCTDDNVYTSLDSPGPELAMPGLHAAPVVAAEAQRQGFGIVGILGTRWTLACSRYAMDLEPMGIKAVALSLRDQTTLHSVIFDELAHDKYLLRSRDYVLDMLHAFRAQGCEAVVVARPEILSLVTPATSPLPLLDPAALLADEAVAVAAGEAPFPEWRGGLATYAPCTDNLIAHESNH